MRPRPVRAYTQTLEFLWEFESMAEAARVACVSGGNIGISCRRPYPMYLGLNWRAVDEDELWDKADTDNPDMGRFVLLCRTSRHGAPRCKIQQYSLEGVFIQEFKNATQAARAVGNGVRNHSILDCCKGTQKQCAGFLWRYADENTHIRALKADATSERFVDGFTDEIDGEVWKPVTSVAYYGVVTYEVSNLARVRKLGYFDSYSQYHPAKLLTPMLDNNGEVSVRLSNGINGCVRSYVSRLVALAFVPNPDNLPIVRHKDGNRLNNLPDNLEWCSKIGLMQANELTKKATIVNSHPIRQYSPDGKLIMEYPSPAEGGRRTGISADNIRWCCNRESKSGLASGFVWRYVSDDELYALSEAERKVAIDKLWVSQRHRK